MNEQPIAKQYRMYHLTESLHIVQAYRKSLEEALPDLATYDEEDWQGALIEVAKNIREAAAAESLLKHLLTCI